MILFLWEKTRMLFGLVLSENMHSQINVDRFLEILRALGPLVHPVNIWLVPTSVTLGFQFSVCNSSQTGCVSLADEYCQNSSYDGVVDVIDGADLDALTLFDLTFDPSE